MNTKILERALEMMAKHHIFEAHRPYTIKEYIRHFVRLATKEAK